jgi:cysteinyl-tRNA synthetase
MLAFVAADLVRRSLEYLGYEVFHIQNFTDVDDKIIEKAREEGRSPAELAQENIDRFFAAADALNLERAHLYPRVTEHVPDIIAYIQRLIDGGHAYAAGGSVWFDVRSYPAYGELSGRKIDELRSAVRVDLDEAKRDPLDFALWKAAKTDEPAWDSPWGRGRPGWHIECSVMSTKYLGITFDFHGGGRDLIFPHHENEMAQSRALEGQFVNYWMHSGLLTLEGRKMAKSTGHFFSVEEVLREFEGDVLRFYLLRGHFRNQMEYSHERLEEAAAAYDRMRRVLLQLDELCARDDLGADLEPGLTTGAGVELEKAVGRARKGFVGGLSDDFNAEVALAALFELIRSANPYLNERAPREMDLAVVGQLRGLLREALGALGLFERRDDGEDMIPKEVQDLVQERERARSARDFARADELRDQILAAGYRLEDGPEGSRIRRA